MTVTRAHSLSEFLEDALRGGIGEKRRFYEEILRRSVVVPVRPRSESLVTVVHEGKTVLPLFSDLDKLRAWCGEEMDGREKEFRSLLWTLAPELWIHLNPNDEFGKEMSPWEIEKLREEDIDEILGDIESGVPDDLEIIRHDPQFDELRSQLRPIFEMYPGLSEAFLISAKNQESEQRSPLVGVKHSGLSDEDVQKLREEIEHAARSYLPPDQTIFFVADLGDERSPNQPLFRDATPFYLAQRQLDTVPSILDRLRQLFRPRKARG